MLGLMISITFASKPKSRDADQKSRIELAGVKAQDEIQAMRAEVSRLRSENTKLQKASAEETGQTKVLSDSLENLKFQAGLTPVAGPGLTIILKDGDTKRIDTNGGFENDYVIHDMDILKVVNELWNSDANAIAVSGNRISSGSNVRCAGTTILVDSVKVASPITIQAIGDPKKLKGAMLMPGGVLEEIAKIDPGMVTVQETKMMHLEAFTGVTSRKFMKAVAETPESAK